MTTLFSEDDVVMTVTRLTRSRLVRFIESDLVKPRNEAGRYVFRPVDVARVAFLCDLSEELELEDAALGIIISLVDQLHAARQDLRVITRMIDTLPADLRDAMHAALRQT